MSAGFNSGASLFAQSYGDGRVKVYDTVTGKASQVSATISYDLHTTTLTLSQRSPTAQSYTAQSQHKPLHAHTTISTAAALLGRSCYFTLCCLPFTPRPFRGALTALALHPTQILILRQPLAFRTLSRSSPAHSCPSDCLLFSQLNILGSLFSPPSGIGADGPS